MNNSITKRLLSGLLSICIFVMLIGTPVIAAPGDNPGGATPEAGINAVYDATPGAEKITVTGYVPDATKIRLAVTDVGANKSQTFLYITTTGEFERDFVKADLTNLNEVFQADKVYELTAQTMIGSGTLYKTQLTIPTFTLHDINRAPIGGTIVSRTEGNVVTKAYDTQVVTLSVTALNGYEYDSNSLAIKDEGNDAVPYTFTGVSNGTYTYTFEMPDEEVTVAATFNTKTYNVEVEDYDEELIAVSVSSTAKFGENKQISVSYLKATKGCLIVITEKGTDNIVGVTTLIDGDYYTGFFIMPASDIVVEVVPVMEDFTIAINKDANITSYGLYTYDAETDTYTLVDPTEYIGNYKDVFFVKFDLDTGYKIKSVKTAAGADLSVNEDGYYSFVIATDNVTITAESEKIDYSLTGTITPAINAIVGGTVEVFVNGESVGFLGADFSATANYGDIITFAIISNLGYSFNSAEFKYDGNAILDNEFVMLAEDVDITAAFDVIYYNIYLSYELTEGNVSVDKEQAYIGQEVKVTVHPAKYFVLNQLGYIVNDTIVPIDFDNLNGGEFTFTMPAGDVNVFASFAEEKAYIYTFVDIDGTLIYTYMSNKLEVPEYPEDPSLEGFNFVDWAVDSWISPDGLKILYVFTAQYERNILNVTFEGVEVVYVPYGETAMELNAPAKKGYTFDGWYLGEDLFDFDTEITTNVTLTAKYTVNEYKVVFRDYWNDIDVVRYVNFGEIMDEIADPSYPGYEFLGWLITAEEGDILFDPAEAYEFDHNLVVYADWGNPVILEVTFDGTDVVKDVYYGETVSGIKPPVKVGYHFIGWYLGEDLFDFDTEITTNVTLTAKYTVNEYTITFVDFVGQNIKRTVNFGEIMEAVADPSYPQYTFIGWIYVTTDGSKVAFDPAAKYEIASDMVIVAVYEDVYVPVTFDNQGDINTVNVPYGVKIFKPSEMPVKLGHDFIGWFNGDMLFDFTSEVTTAITLTAKFAPSEYTVTFRNLWTDEEDDFTKTVVYGGTIELGDIVIPAGVIFGYWGLAENTDIVFDPSEEYTYIRDITVYLMALTARGSIEWDPGKTGGVEPTVDENVITFNGKIAWYGPAVTGGTGLYGNMVGVKIQAPEGLVDFTNAKLYIGEKEYDATAFDGENFFYYYPTVTKANQKFIVVIDWDGTGMFKEVYQIIIKDCTLEAAPEFDVIFTDVDTVKVPYGENVEALDAPAKKGYTFIGWFNGEEKFDFNTNITTNVTLTAEYTVNEYKVTFRDYWNATEDVIRLVKFGEIIDEVADPSYSGFEFLGWLITAEEGEIPFDPTKAYEYDHNLVVYANWGNPVILEVTFDGTDVVKDVYYGETVSGIKPPVKVGYHFIGWYLNGEEFDFNTPITEDIILTPLFEADEYTVTFKNLFNGYTVTKSVLYGGIIEIADFEMAGYTFEGWKVSSDVLGEDFIPADPYMYTSDLVIYASFDKHQGTIAWDDEKTGGVEPIIKDYVAIFNGEIQWYLYPDGSNGNYIAVKLTAPEGVDTANAKVYLSGSIYSFDEIFNDERTFTIKFNIPADYPSNSVDIRVQWDGTDKFDEIFTIVIKDCTFESADTFDVVFVDGENENGVIVSYGDSVEKPETPYKKGYTFAGWFNGEEEFDFSTAITTNIVLNAKYTANTYTITFIDYLNGIKTIDVEYGKTVIAPITGYRGYTFEAWIYENAVRIFEPELPYDYEEDITVVAVYSKNTGNISWDPGKTGTKPIISGGKAALFTGLIPWYGPDVTGGTGLMGNFVGVRIEAPEGLDLKNAEMLINGKVYTYKDFDEERAFYYYVKVTDESEVVAVIVSWDGSQEFVENYYIGFEEIELAPAPTFDVTFVAEGMDDKIVTVDYGVTVDSVKAPLNEGFRFIGWFDGEDLFDFDTMITTNIVLTAKYEKIPYNQYNFGEPEVVDVQNGSLARITLTVEKTSAEYIDVNTLVVYVEAQLKSGKTIYLYNFVTFEEGQLTAEVTFALSKAQFEYVDAYLTFDIPEDYAGFESVDDITVQIDANN